MQFLKSTSNNLTERTPNTDYRGGKIESTTYLSHDFNNLYRTSYNDMIEKVPKLLNQHYIPRYQGYIPGLNCENAMAKSVTNLANQCIKKFDQRRFNPVSINKNEWQFNPISTTFGEFSKRNFSNTIKPVILYFKNIRLLIIVLLIN